MKKLSRKHRIPGRAIFTGKVKTETQNADLFVYDEKSLDHIPKVDLNSFGGFIDKTKQYWLNIYGLHDVESITSICKKLDINDLVIQDIVNTYERPKVQIHSDYWHVSMKSNITFENNLIKEDQISIISGENFIVSFQEMPADYFNHIRERLKNNLGMSRKENTQFLLFLLIESILDNYYITIDKIEKQTELLQFHDKRIKLNPNLLEKIDLLQRTLFKIKRSCRPVKEIINMVDTNQIQLFRPYYLNYFIELKDLSETIIDDTDYYKNILDNKINLFFSVQGDRMNQVIKILTVISTFFIPITFIAGVYGMNFEFMPELGWKWAYPAVWAIMLSVILSMFIYFKVKKWF